MQNHALKSNVEITHKGLFTNPIFCIKLVHFWKKKYFVFIKQADLLGNRPLALNFPTRLINRYQCNA
jgi:hypothetical protein